MLRAVLSAAAVVAASSAPSPADAFDGRGLLAGVWHGSLRIPAAAAAASPDDDGAPLALAPALACTLNLTVSPGAAADKPLTGDLVCGADFRASWRVEFTSTAGERGSVWERRAGVGGADGKGAKWARLCEFALTAVGDGGAVTSAVRSSGAGHAAAGAGAAAWCFLAGAAPRAAPDAAHARLLLDVRDAGRAAAPLRVLALERAPAPAAAQSFAARYGTYFLVVGIVVLQVVLKSYGITRRIGAPPARARAAALAAAAAPATAAGSTPAAPAPAPAEEKKKER
jgi:hypothetical protein